MDPLVMLPIATVLIIAVTALAPKTGVAAPLILVAVGIALSFLPQLSHFEIEPEWILAGILPPLLYSAAVSLPVMDFRRDFTAISLLSVLLVVISALVLGLAFRALIPDLGLAGGVALGAIVSPTDAVATSIVRGLGAPARVVTVLEGEGLLNDATSMVLLRSAIAATAVALSFGGFLRTFTWAVIGAVLCGMVAGWLGLAVRRKIRNPALTTAVSFVVPFVAFIPAEEIGASGLVAVVVAGLITGFGSAKLLTPQDRFFEHANWSTAGNLVEGALFLLMGLQLASTVEQVLAGEDHLRLAVFVALLAMVLVTVIRALFVAPLLLHLHKVAMAKPARRTVMTKMQGAIDARLTAAKSADTIDLPPWQVRGRSGRSRQVPASRRVSVLRLREFQTRLIRRISDADYLTSKPLGPREGTLLVWAGMRGVVTLAAAQTLPRDFPHRALVVLIAYFVAAGTLLIQGGSLPYVVRRLGLANQQTDDPQAVLALREVVENSTREFLTNPYLRRADGSLYDPVVVQRLLADLDDVTDHFENDEDPELRKLHMAEYSELRLRCLTAQRNAILDVRAQGTQDSEHLASVLNAIDVQQIAMEMQHV